MALRIMSLIFDNLKSNIVGLIRALNCDFFYVLQQGIQRYELVALRSLKKTTVWVLIVKVFHPEPEYGPAKQSQSWGSHYDNVLHDFLCEIKHFQALTY